MSNPKKILFIINPISGIGKKNKLPGLIEKKLDPDTIVYDIAYTEHKGHGREIAEAKKHDFDAIVAVGGDGSVNEIGSALIHSNCALGIIPTGSGNGFARHLKIPLKAEKALAILNQWKVLSVDTGCINEIPFLGTCGIGFDAHIAKKFDEFHKRGFLSYIKLVIREFSTYKAFNLTIRFGETRLKRQPIMACVANSSQFGNGFYISPNSNVTDGTFELALLDDFNFIKSLKIGAQFFAKRIQNSKYYEAIRFSENLQIDLNNNETIQLHVDGEPKSSTNPLTIRVHESSLNVLVPGQSKAN